MPSASAEGTSFPIVKMMPYANHIGQETAGYTSRDVDVLVSRLKEDLRLSSLKSRSSLAQQKCYRATPYRLPSRLGSCTESCCTPCVSRSKRCRESTYANDYDDDDDDEHDESTFDRPCFQRLQHYHHQQHHRNRHNRHRGVRYYHQHKHYCRHCNRKSSNSSSAYSSSGLCRELEDSYERFEALLRKGSLIKEAVKRLKTNPEKEEEEEEEEEGDDEIETETETEDEDAAVARLSGSTLANSNVPSFPSVGCKSRTPPTYSTAIEDSMEDDDDDDYNYSANDADFLYRRKPFFYDSEDEPLPAIYQQSNLDL